MLLWLRVLSKTTAISCHASKDLRLRAVSIATWSFMVVLVQLELLDFVLVSPMFDLSVDFIDKL